MTHPPSHFPKVFRYLNFFETQKGSSTKFCGSVEQQIFDWNLWYSLSPPLLSIKFIVIKIFSETPECTLLTSVLRGKKIDENRDAPPLSLILNFFGYQKHKSHPTKIFGSVRQIFFWRRIVIPPSLYA